MINEMRTKIALELDPEVLPETVEFFELHKDEDLSAYDLATALIQCDKTVDMPRCLFDFIVSLYENAIADGNTYAMNDLGALYYDGRGCEQDFRKSLEDAIEGQQRARAHLGAFLSQ